VLLGIVLLAAACSSSGDDAIEATTAAEPVAAAPADDAMEDDAMADEEDAMEDDAMEDDAMADDAMEDEEDAMADEEHDGPVLALEFAGLEPLGDAAVYEGWVIVDGAPVSTGRFNLDADGSIVAEDGGDHQFVLPEGTDATAVVISIEPTVDPDPAPAPTKVLGGDIVDGVAELTIAHPAALGTDFADASGLYILGTPTDGDGNNELSGVWFIDLPLAAGLDLPELPEGWHYEGWAVIDGQPITTGRFTSASGADDFDGFSGDQGGPPYPGEDFIVNAPDGVTFPTDLTDATIVISVEPDPDDSPAPFAIKPLVSEVPDGIADHTVQSLGAGPAAPTGVAVIG
jgi:pentapeptide MXKDX repeat protein